MPRRLIVDCLTIKLTISSTRTEHPTIINNLSSILLKIKVHCEQKQKIYLSVDSHQIKLGEILPKILLYLQSGRQCVLCSRMLLHTGHIKSDTIFLEVEFELRRICKRAL